MQEQENEYGDFTEVKEESGKQTNSEPDQPQFSSRIRHPRKGQLAGIVVERLGGNRMMVKATDNKTRNARVPGRFKRRFWLRPGDAVIIEPWPDDDEKADIVYQYRKNEKHQLNKSGILDAIKNEF